MEQKEAVQDAIKQAADDEEKARLLGDLRSLTSKLYSLSGKAKVRCGTVNGGTIGSRICMLVAGGSVFS